MKTIISIALLTLASSSAMAANCAKNPNHSSCQGGDTTVIIDNSGLPTVVNGDGSAIGKAFAMGTFYDTSAQKNRGWADVRLTFNTATEGEVGYSLRFYNDGIAVGFGGWNTAGKIVYRNAGCIGSPDFIALSANSRKMTGFGVAPFLSDSFIPLQHATADGNSVSLVRLSQPGYGYLPSPHYQATGTSCVFVSSGGYEYLYEVLEGYELGSQFSAPITFVPSATN